MEVAPEVRVATTPPSHSTFRIGALVALFFALGLGLLAVPELRAYAEREAYFAASLVGAGPPDEFAAVYRTLGIEPLSAGLAISPKISSSLARLTKETCDKNAIFDLTEALGAAKQARIAANALLGFAGNCPNGEGEANRAAQLFFQLADNDKVIAITSTLIQNNPAVPDYHYLRGKAMAAAKRYQEALADYTTTIELQKNPRAVSERVFVEMANIYRAVGNPCAAVRTILAWITIDPADRNTPDAHKMIDEYAGQGCRPGSANPGFDKL